MINSQDEKSATFRPNERVMGGYKEEQLQGHDILPIRHEMKQGTFCNSLLSIWLFRTIEKLPNSNNFCQSKLKI